MSFMTFVIFSWILFLIIFTIHNQTISFDNNTDELFIIKETPPRKQNDDTPTILAYIAIIAAVIIPHIPQID
jgi:predicted RND superfamily exporter protein